MRIVTFLKTCLVLSILLVSLSLTSVSPTLAQISTCPHGLPARLIVGRQAHVTPGAANNVRAQPSKSAPILGQVMGDEYADVIGGPNCADNLNWWQMQYGSLTGWMAEGSGSTYYAEPTTSEISRFGLVYDNKTVTVQFGEVNFIYNGSFGKTAEATTVYVVKPNQNNPFQYAAPAHVEFRFPDAAQLPYRIPKLAVYPAADYQRVNEYVGQQLPALSALLKARPANPSDSIPAMPPVNAGEIFHSNVKYLAFGGGTGVQFITIFGQGFGPVTNEPLYYIFQGLTANGDHLVTAWFPISASVLPANAGEATDFPDISSPQAADLFKAYLQKMTAKLNVAAPGDFMPNLDQVDALLQSVTVQ